MSQDELLRTKYGELFKGGVHLNYLVIDLEMCKVPKNYRGKSYKYASEIIQVGAVLLDKEYKEIGTLCQYVHPEYGVLDYFITNLTGIENGQVKNAPKLKDALIYMVDWLGEREYKIFAWSKSDYCQFDHEITSKHLENEKIREFMNPERWIDYQEIFGKKYHFEQPVGLKEALMLCDIEPDGRLHDGLDDARNTARLIEKLEKNPEYKLVYREREEEMRSQPLKVSLGDLFKGLDIQFE